ncbi:acyl carrier protein [Paenibacillus tyrfis]|uniref:acyl carrier protein n=1 Tax=Paenibacillus tyrfis TaxID=1501230 RepID=UPI0020A10135|nr:phosphopantetheine-binding protein [Paenibacillus tyrfis]MCP1311728.1 phosphopantetheine-binding protein [Paenibacillus tyrfis]
MMHTESEARALIRQFIEQNMSAFKDADELGDTDNIFEKGFVTSIFAMRLLDFIENKFGVQVPDEDITLMNFSSVDRMIGLVGKVRGASNV